MKTTNIQFGVVTSAFLLLLSACDGRTIRVPVAVNRPATTSVSTPQITATPDSLPRELVEQLINPVAYLPFDSNLQPEIIVGKVPALIAAEISLPTTARVLGGISQGQQGALVVLKTSAKGEDTLKAFEKMLVDKGWKKPENQYAPGGFLPTGMPDSGVGFLVCKSDVGPSLSIYAAPDSKSAETVIKITFSDNEKDLPANSYGQCKQPPDGMGGFPPPVMPALTAPKGVQQVSSGGGGGDSMYATTADLITDKPLEALVADYNGQLQKAGWTLLDKGSSSQTVWSTWSFKDKNEKVQSGFLFLIKTNRETKKHFVSLQITLG